MQSNVDVLFVKVTFRKTSSIANGAKYWAHTLPILGYFGVWGHFWGI